MLIDYEEDDIFNTSINSSKLEEQINCSPNKSSLSSSHFLSKSNYSLDEIENETSINMISKLNNTHLLKLISELVRTFFEITHEIEFCLNYYVNKQKLAHLKQIKSSDQLNELDNSNRNHQINKSLSFTSYPSKAIELNNYEIKSNESNLNSINQANQQIDQIEDEFVCDNVIPIPEAKQLKAISTKSQLNNNDSIILKESNSINNSNYFEISCSYIVQLNNFNNSTNQSIVEDKKTYISANINVNNCYNNKEIIKKNLLIDTKDDNEIYSEALDDQSENIKCPTFNFSLKNKSIINNKEPQINNQNNFKELIDKKMMIFNRSLINLSKCNDLIDIKNLNGKLEINKYDSNYSDYLEEEDLVISLCMQLKELINGIIEFMKSISTTGDLENVLKILLNKNSDLSTKLKILKNENLKLENEIKNVNEKDSNLKFKIIDLKHFLNEYKQNQDRLEWLLSSIDELKNEIKDLKENEKNCKSILDKRLKDNLTNNEDDDNEIFEDCLEKLDDNQDESINYLVKKLNNDEIIHFDRIEFEDTFKSIQHSCHQKNMVNLLNDEKFELNKLINNLKNEIEQLILNNEEIDKLKQLQYEDYTQHLNCLKKLINSNRKFLNEQTNDRDNEKETFDTKLTKLNCLIKEKDLSLIKCKEKSEFLKIDLEELLTEKDDLQCKSYNQGRKLIDLMCKQDELIQSIDRLQDENNNSSIEQEQLRMKLEDYEKQLDEAKLLFDKLKFDDKIELDDNFLKMLDDVIKRINRYYMKEKIRDHLNRKKLIDKKEKLNQINKNQLNNLMKSKTFIKPTNELSSNNSTNFKPILRNRSLKIKDSSTPIRTNSFSLYKSSSVKATNQLSNKIPRSKSFMSDELINDNLSKLNRRSIKLNDELFTNFLSKLKSPKKRVLDDEEFYSFKECQSLISLNNDLDNLNRFKSNDSLYSLKSSILDEDDNSSEIDNNFKIMNLNETMNSSTTTNSSTINSSKTNSSSKINAYRSLSEDTFYFSLTSEETTVNNELNLNDLYSQLDRCKDTDKIIKLKHYAIVIINFFQQITKNINQSKDILKNTILNNQTKTIKLIELEKIFEQLKLIYDKERINLENLQNKLNLKHLELSELKNQIDSNLDNSLFIENKQILQELEQRSIDNEDNQHILQTNLNHLERSLKRRDNESKNLNEQLINVKNEFNLNTNRNKQMKIENENLEKENLELYKKLKKIREEKLYKKLKMIRN